MNTTTTTAEGRTAGPVFVAPAHMHMNTGLRHLLAQAEALRVALEPFQHLAETVGREAERAAMNTTTAQRTAAAIVRNLTHPVLGLHPSVQGHRRRVAAAGRSHHLAALDADLRRIAHGHAGIAVRIVRLIADLHAQGRDYEADLVAAALRGDEESLRDIASLVAEGAPLGLQVLAIADQVDALAADLRVITHQVETLIASVIATEVRNLAEPITPPRTFLAGSVDTTAPPAHLQRGRGRTRSIRTPYLWEVAA